MREEGCLAPAFWLILAAQFAAAGRVGAGLGVAGSLAGRYAGRQRLLRCTCQLPPMQPAHFQSNPLPALPISPLLQFWDAHTVWDQLEAGAYFKAGAGLPPALEALRAGGAGQAAAAHALGGCVSHLRDVLLDKQVGWCAVSLCGSREGMCVHPCRGQHGSYGYLLGRTAFLPSMAHPPTLLSFPPPRCWRPGGWSSWRRRLALVRGWPAVAPARHGPAARLLGHSAWPWMALHWRTWRRVRGMHAWFEAWCS